MTRKVSDAATVEKMPKEAVNRLVSHKHMEVDKGGVSYTAACTYISIGLDPRLCLQY